jgi:hypothetical protein
MATEHEIKSDMLNASLALARQGCPTFPAGRDKKPLVKGWPQVATTDEGRIEGWYNVPTPPNIGLLTGDKSGLFVLDVDGPDGFESLAELETRYGATGCGCMARTPSGGLHLYFKMPNFDLRNSARTLAPGLDIRANGGYVLAPPSRALSRDGGLGNYMWLNEGGLLVGEPSEAPGWLLDLLREPTWETTARPPVLSNGKAYGRKALEEECRRLASAPQGSRNDTLNRASFAVFQLVEGGEIDRHEAEAALTQAALSTGLAIKEVAATLSSARRKAVEKPRSAPTATYAEHGRPRIVPTIEASPPPLEIFPPKIQKMLKEAAVAFKHLPLEVPIVALLSMLSACIGQSRVLLVKDNWEEAANLYIALVANSGLGKSPCFKEFLRPLWKEEVRNKEIWDSAMDGYLAIMEERRRHKDKTEDVFVPSKPIRIQHIIEDATTEAIGAILAENPRGLLWYGDELSSIILNLDRYSNSKGGTKSRLLSTYDRSPWKTSRRDRDKDQVIPSAALSIVGTVQPKILAEIFGQSDALSGFLPRFIFILARRERPPLLTNEIFTGQEILEKITRHLLVWQMVKSGEQWLPHKVKMSPAAYELYEAWHNRVVSEAWRDSEVDQAITAKLVTQVIRLALLLHSLKAALAESDGQADLEAETMQEAVTLGTWIRNHQRHIWLALNIQSEPEPAPLERAIMSAAVSAENFLADNQWRMSNDEFNERVIGELGESIDPSLIGRAAGKLGLGQCAVGKKRGREFSLELLADFRRRLYL